MAATWRQYVEIGDAPLVWWKIRRLASSSSFAAVFSSRSCITRARRVGESTRGCRLDADNAGGVSFVQSSMTLLSSLLFSSRLVRASPRSRKRDASRCALNLTARSILGRRDIASSERRARVQGSLQGSNSIFFDCLGSRCI